ncbi:MAG TPA: PIN domain nuclease [Segeticoccus sp.]|nr:PIN domain nuclease [Segeticoccus sp.]
MVVTTSHRWLIDKSAYARLGSCAHPEVWANRIQHGLIHICTPTVLELGYSARSAEDWSLIMQQSPMSLMPIEYATPHIESRAREVQGLLARRGEHRAPSVPDLLIAATAELTGLVVLHADKDFDAIGNITGQEAEWLT